MFNFVSLLKYKRQMTGNKLCKPAQRSGRDPVASNQIASFYVHSHAR